MYTSSLPSVKCLSAPSVQLLPPHRPLKFVNKEDSDGEGKWLDFISKGNSSPHRMRASAERDFFMTLVMLLSVRLMQEQVKWLEVIKVFTDAALCC